MTWSDVEVGQSVTVKGETWRVVARDGDKITMRHSTLGERSGCPPGDGDVEVVPTPQKASPAPERTASDLRAIAAATEQDRDVDLEKLRAYAKEQGIAGRGMDETELREAIQNLHAKRVAEDNGVPERKVTDVTLRLILGATLIAELHEGSEVAQTPQVEVMDRQTFSNHLHFLHDTYPAESVPMDELVRTHQQSHDKDQETQLHEHSLKF